MKGTIKLRRKLIILEKKLIIFLILDESVSHSRHQRNTLTLPAEQKLNIIRAVARKKLKPRRTHGPLYKISRMKSSNIISLIKKIKIDSIW